MLREAPGDGSAAERVFVRESFFLGESLSLGRSGHG